MAGFKRTQKRAAAADSDSEKPQKKKKKESSKPVLKTATVGGQKSAKKQLSSGADNDGNPFWEVCAIVVPELLFPVSASTVLR